MKGFPLFLKRLIPFEIAVLIVLGNACAGNPSAQKASSPASVAGGVDGSGGSASKSTPEQVVAATQGWQKKIRDLFYRIELELKGESRFETEAENAFRAMIQGSTFQSQGKTIRRAGINSLLQQMPKDLIETTQSSPCLTEEEANQEACVTQNDKIFLNPKKLTRIPTSSLEVEIPALITHELAHYYGFNQAHALSAQNSILEFKEMLFPTTERWVRLHQMTTELPLKLDTIIESLMDKKSTQQICAQLDDLVAPEKPFKRAWGEAV